MIAPLVHLNGSAKVTLIKQNRDARRAVEKAIEALIAGQPNQRDYYPLGDAIWPKAVREHDARVKAMRCVADELDAIQTAIENDMPGEQGRGT